MNTLTFKKKTGCIWIRIAIIIITKLTAAVILSDTISFLYSWSYVKMIRFFYFFFDYSFLK